MAKGSSSLKKFKIMQRLNKMKITSAEELQKESIKAYEEMQAKKEQKKSK